MLYLYPYIAIYRGPKKGEELRKYLISHMKNMDVVSAKLEKSNSQFQEVVKIANQSHADMVQQIKQLKAKVKFLQQIKE